MNHVRIIFLLMTSGVVILGGLINKFEQNLPVFFRQIFRYGKFAYNGKRSKFDFQVRKSTFKQFYEFAILCFSVTLYLVVSVYLFGASVPLWTKNLLNFTCGRDRIAGTTTTNTFIAVILLTLQVYRRFYDTHYVSVFGAKSKINFNLYIIGMIYYPLVALAVLCESPKFASSSLNNSSISIYEICSICVFLWAWYHQHVTTVILAKLRKNSDGKIVTEGYKLPCGDWFQYLSCPHQTAEILMYLSLSVLLWENVTWRYVLFWVLSNQVETILLSHWWYQETFKDFPKNRKALIPFVY